VFDDAAVGELVYVYHPPSWFITNYKHLPMNSTGKRWIILQDGLGPYTPFYDDFIEAAHAWDVAGTYEITVRARNNDQW